MRLLTRIALLVNVHAFDFSLANFYLQSSNMDSVSKTCIELVCGTCENVAIRDTFLRISNELDEKHKSVYEEIDSCLSEREAMLGETNRLGSLTSVLDNLFEDNLYNWGRVVTAISWARKISGTKEAGEIVANKLTYWICMNGGFDEFVKFFNPRGSISLGDISLAAAGIAASLALLWL